MDYKEKVIALLNDKELSQEQKEKLEAVFPELKEREDKMWRNWLISHLKGYINQTDNKYAEVCKEAIAWLDLELPKMEE